MILSRLPWALLALTLAVSAAHAEPVGSTLIDDQYKTCELVLANNTPDQQSCMKIVQQQGYDLTKSGRYDSDGLCVTTVDMSRCSNDSQYQQGSDAQCDPYETGCDNPYGSDPTNDPTQVNGPQTPTPPNPIAQPSPQSSPSNAPQVKKPAWVTDGKEWLFYKETDSWSILYVAQEDNQLIKFTGQLVTGIGIDTSAFNHVISMIRKGKTVVLELNSEGGMWDSMKPLYDALRGTCDGAAQCHITSYVASGDHCNSACIALFMSGDNRYAGTTAHFGFHKASYEIGPLKFDMPGEYEKMLKSVGVNAQWIDSHPELFASTEIKEDVSYLTSSQMVGSGIVTANFDAP